MKLRDKVILTTFGFFMIEAVMHYNQGKKSCDCPKEEQSKKWLPPTKNLLKLAVVVGVFSVINGVIIKGIEKK